MSWKSVPQGCKRVTEDHADGKHQNQTSSSVLTLIIPLAQIHAFSDSLFLLNSLFLILSSHALIKIVNPLKTQSSFTLLLHLQ